MRGFLKGKESTESIGSDRFLESGKFLESGRFLGSDRFLESGRFLGSNRFLGTDSFLGTGRFLGTGKEHLDKAGTVSIRYKNEGNNRDVIISGTEAVRIQELWTYRNYGI